MDISETGSQIAEKLLVLLDDRQRQELEEVIISRMGQNESLACPIWGEEYIDITPKTIHNLMSRVRHKLQVSPNTHSYIVYVRGVRYKFNK